MKRKTFLNLSIGLATANITSLILQGNNVLANDSNHYDNNYLNRLSSNSICSGNKKRKQIALTFDDGPSSQTTIPILKILKKYGIKATFFCIGENIARNPKVLVDIYQNGHLICNHTYKHENLTQLNEDQILQTLEKTNREIEKIGLPRPKFFRAPKGEIDAKVYKIAKELNLQHIGWSVDTNDWDTKISEDNVIQTLVQKTKNGSIILCHDGVPESNKTRYAIDKAIPRLFDQKFKFVTISNLLSRGNLITADNCYNIQT